MKLIRKILPWFIGCTLILLVVAIFSYKNSEKLITSEQWVNHTHEVLYELEQTLTNSVDAETGERGYIITGNENYLEPFKQSKLQIFAHLDKTQALTIDNVTQQKNIKDITDTVNVLIKRLNKCIEVRKLFGFEKAKELVSMGNGKRLLDAIRKQIDKAKGIERTLLVKRKQESEDVAHNFNLIYLILLAVIILVLSIVYIIITVNLRAIKKAEDELRKFNEELERRVNERTELLFKSEEKYRRVIENINDALIIDDKDGKIIFANDKYLSLFKFSQEDIGIINLENYVAPAYREMLIERHNKRVRGEAVPTRFEYQAINKLGELFWVEVSVVPIIESNVIVGTQSFIRDITERKRVEEKIEQSEKKYRQLFENNPMPMWIIDRFSFKFLDVNGAAIKHYGYSREEFLSMTAVDIRPEEEKIVFIESDHSIKADNVNRGIWKHKKKDGTIILVEIVVTEIMFEGSYVNLILANDVTVKLKVEEEIKKLNEELEERVNQRTEQLEIVNKELDSFTYSVSHDLRAPLRSINGFTEVLMDKYINKLDDEAKRYMNIVIDNAKRMGQLIDDLLLFSRLGKQHLQKTKLDMNAIVYSVWNDLTQHLDTNKIELKIEHLHSAYGDENMMKQAFINLISNALKYSNKKEKQAIEIDSYGENKTIVYYIKDNGAGFDMKFYDKLFGVFQRLHSTKEFEGTGVGLSIVQRIITKHGGKVWAEGKVDEGATFYFSLPE